MKTPVEMQFLVVLLALHLVSEAPADTPDWPTQMVLATYRLDHPKTSGTAFIVSRPDPADNDSKQLLVVTTAHAFEQMDDNQTKILLRQQNAGGDWSAKSLDLEIRRANEPLWHKHPKQDVAVIEFEQEKGTTLHSVPLDVVASAADWKRNAPVPGSLVRCVGFPHAAQFKPSKAGFPLTRLGCLASYPLTPVERHPTFLVDYNTFEGDSGGPVYLERTVNGRSQVKIIGIVVRQHFVDERYKLVYQEGLIRKRLGLAVVAHSQAILETIASLP